MIYKDSIKNNVRKWFKIIENNSIRIKANNILSNNNSNKILWKEQEKNKNKINKNIRSN